VTDSEDALAVGQTITNEDGSVALPEGGEIVLADDTKITIDKDGKITSIIPVAAAEDNVENLKAKVADLETKLAAAKAIENEVVEMQTELKAIVSTYKPKAQQQQFRKQEQEPENRVNDAKTRREQYKKK
jgi:flagellar basal body rod protein FlgF